MTNVKKITVSAFEKVMKETYTPVETFDWNGIEVTVKKTLSLKEMLEFVDSVVKSCFIEDGSIYMPEIREFATRLCILEKYANFTLPRNTDNKYDLVYHTDAVDHVVRFINTKQLQEIERAISAKIENRTQANIATVNKQMNELFLAFDNLQNQFLSLFNGVSSEDVNAVLNAISNGAMSEEKFIRAYMEQKNKTGEQ